jgi:NADH-quinone oxidoreductase subunit L
LFLVIPAATAALLFLRPGPARSSVVCGAMAVAAELSLLGIAIWPAATRTSSSVAWGPRLRIELAVGGTGAVMVWLVPLIALPVVGYAASDRARDAVPRLLGWLVAFTGAMELLVLAGDFLTLLIGWELVGVCSWALVGLQWTELRKVTAARDVFITTRFGDLGLYVASAAMFAGTGSLRFADIATLHGASLHVVAGGLLLAAAAKSAQLPFSPWLFRAMEGPTPASALLHSATMVAAGAYVLSRLEPSLSQADWLAPATLWLGLATAVAGGMVAATQRDLKRALAASTSAQYGLMFASIGAGFTAVAGLHLVAHAVFKSLLFLGAGIALHAANTLDLERLSLGRRYPRIAAAFWIGTLALAALPPLGAAYTKEQIVAAVATYGIWSTIAVLIAGGLSAFYAGRIALLAFGARRAAFIAAADDRAASSAPTLGERIAVYGLAVLTLAGALVWLPHAGSVFARITGGSLPIASSALDIVSIGITVGALVVAYVLWTGGSLATLRLRRATADAISGWMGLSSFARVAVVTPGLAVSRALATFDDRVVDAGIRAAERVGQALSRALAGGSERGIDDFVAGIAGATTATASAGAGFDDTGVDGTVEGVGRAIDSASGLAQRLQTGFTHDYFLIVAVGVVIAAAVAAWH